MGKNKVERTNKQFSGKNEILKKKSKNRILASTFTFTLLGCGALLFCLLGSVVGGLQSLSRVFLLEQHPAPPLAKPQREQSAETKGFTLSNRKQSESIRVAGVSQDHGSKKIHAESKRTHPNKIRTATIKWRGHKLEAVAGEWLYWPPSRSDRPSTEALIKKLNGQIVRSSTGVWRVIFSSHHAGVLAASWLSQKGVKGLRPHFVARGVRYKRKGLRALPAELPKSAFWYHKLSRLDFAKSSPKGGRGVVIALLDTGIAYKDHAIKRGEQWVRFRRAPAFANTEILEGKNFVEKGQLPLDDNHHGTFLATMIAGKHGIAPGATLLPVKVLDSQQAGTELSVAEGIRYAVDRGADMINLSLVFPAGYFPGRLLTEAIQYALSKEVLVIAASGNAGKSDNPLVRFPAAYSPVLAVGAGKLGTKKQGRQVAQYSSYGGALDLLAPGGNLQQDLNRDQIPDGIVSQTFAAHDPSTFAMWVMSGTSVAAAYTTGAAALLLSRGRSSAQATASLIKSATSLRRHRAFHPRSGWGWINVKKSLKTTAKSVAKPRRCYANMMPAVLRTSANKRAGVMHVELLNHKKKPMAGAHVYARWLGLSSASQRAKTNKRGIVTFRSSEVTPNASIFGFALEMARKGQSPCSLKVIYRVTEGSLVALQNAEQSSSLHVLHLDQQYLALAYPSLSTMVQPTTMLIPSGAGLLSSVRVFGGNLLYQTATTEWPSYNWAELWSMGVGNTTYPLDLGGGGASQFWSPVAVAQQQPVYWSSLSKLLATAASRYSVASKNSSKPLPPLAQASSHHAQLLKAQP